MKPTKDDVVPKSLQNQLERLFGVDSREARSKIRSVAAWRKTLKRILTELDRYRAANVDTDSLHNLMLDCALASAYDALKLPNFWPGYVEGVVRFALCLMGDYPDHHARKTGKRRKNHYKLDSHRSIIFLQTSKQQCGTLFMASALKGFNVPHPFWEVKAAFRDKYGFAASESQFMMWFKKTYPESVRHGVLSSTGGYWTLHSFGTGLTSIQANRYAWMRNESKKMNQHHVQEAYLKGFEDETGKLWVYAKNGGKPLHRPAKQCTAEENFQSDELESFQNRFIETPGIKALRAADFLSERENGWIALWMALHILRNQKLFESRKDYDAGFKPEFEKERVFSGYYRFVFTYRPADDAHFFLTSDSPVIEFTVGDHLVRCCSITPQKMILFSPINDIPTHELRIEDFFNAMVYANAVKEVFSHRGDVSMARLKGLAETYGIFPIKEDIGFQVENGVEGEPGLE